MKTMSCRELGGACDQELTAKSWNEMVNLMARHIVDAHQDVAEKLEKMHNEDPGKWVREMKPKWDATLAA